MMKNCFTYSKSGLALTESFEADGGPKLTAYDDPLKPGVWTIGYGHTGPDVHPGLTWTPQQCEEALAKDIFWASNVVNRLVTFSLNQNEFDSLVDFTFNVGAGNFAKSTMLKDLNAGQISLAAAQFETWDHASGKVVAGLLRRRLAEKALFQKAPAD